jgi:hypothetical protein
LKIESKELTEYEVDVVGVQEVRLDKGAWTAIFLYSCHSQVFFCTWYLTFFEVNFNTALYWFLDSFIISSAFYSQQKGFIFQGYDLSHSIRSFCCFWSPSFHQFKKWKRNEVGRISKLDSAIMLFFGASLEDWIIHKIVL